MALSYDPALRLYEVTGSGGTTRFGYDGSDLIAEYNSSNSLLRRYVHGPGADEPLVWYEGSGLSDRRWFHADERGSVIAISTSGGSATIINAYDEYGIPASTNAGRFQYTGQTWLPEVGLYYYKARIYSPTLGRFLQTDPIGYGDGINWYAYVGNDPVNATDPSGLCVVVENPGGGVYPPVNCPSPSTPRATCFGRDCIWAPVWRSLPNPDGGGGGEGGEGEEIVVSAAKKKALSQIEWPIDKCSIGYQIADWGLWGVGLIGDGVAIAGIVTANPLLIGVGKGVSIGANLGSTALHASAGDGASLAGDALGLGTSAITGGGGLVRKVYGAAGDAGLDAGGRFVKNHAARRKAQDTVIQNAQGRYASSLTSGLGGC